eukprot:EG_transcript_2104
MDGGFPRRFQLPSAAPLLDSGRFHVAFIGAVVAGVGLSVAVVCVQRQRRRGRLQRSHEKRMGRWIQQYTQELKEFTEAQEDVPEQERRVAALEVDSGSVFDLWSLGKKLRCSNGMLEQLAVISATAFNQELRQMVLRLQRDFDLLVLRNLPTILRRIKEMGIEGEMDPGIFGAAREAVQALSHDSLACLGRVMLTSSRLRIVGICLTMAVALIGDRVCTEASNAFDHLTETVLTPSPSTRAIVLKWVGLHIFYSLADSAVDLVRHKVSHMLSHQFRRSIERKLCSALSRMDTEFFDAHTPSELNDLTYVGEELGEADVRLQSTMSKAIMVISRGHYLWATSPRLSLVTTGIATAAAVFQKIADRVEHLTSDYQEEVEDGDGGSDAIVQTAANMTLNGILQNVRTLRAFGREEALVHAWVENKFKAEQSEQDHQNPDFFTHLFMCMSNLSTGYWRLLAMWCGTQLVVGEWVPEPAPLNVYQYTIQVFNLMQDLQSLDFQWLSSCAMRAHLLSTILDYTPKIECDGGFIPEPGAFRGDIEFRDVEFAYPIRPDRPILRGLSLRVASGQVLAVVGHSGCGKTTIMSLLLRFYDPDRGCILVDGRDLREYHPKWLRKQIAHVSQEVQLFNMSIEDNIRIGVPSATFAEVVDACKRANAYGFITKLPGGFKTHIGPNNFQLSGGQKQRIAIARALVMGAKILMLDEATSALDPESQCFVNKALKEVMRDRTTLFVTHRLTTTRTADSIAVVLAGRCVESGTHDELMAAAGPYERLLRGEMAVSPEEEPEEELSPEKTWSFSSKESVELLSEREEQPYHVEEIAQLEKALGRVQNANWVDHSVFETVAHDLRVVLKSLQTLNHSFAAREIREALVPAIHKLSLLTERVAGLSAGEAAFSHAGVLPHETWTPSPADYRLPSPRVLVPSTGSMRLLKSVKSEEAMEEEEGFSYHAGS